MRLKLCENSADKTNEDEYFNAFESEDHIQNVILEENGLLHFYEDDISLNEDNYTIIHNSLMQIDGLLFNDSCPSSN